MPEKNITNDEKRFAFILFLLSLILIALFFVSMFLGRFKIPFGDVFSFFTFRKIPDMSSRVLLHLRIPRALCAILIGAALSVSGTMYQSMFKNHLVSPDLLGVSSGASVGACLAILLGFSSGFISLFAFAFGFIAVLLTLLLSYTLQNKSIVTMILCGLAVSGLMSSFVGLMKYLADNEMKLAEMTFWLLGSLAKVTMDDFFVLFPVILICSFVALSCSWKLNIISLGEKEAKSLGVNYRFFFILLIATATALTAFSVSVGGTIGWVGLVVPNFVRLLVGSNNKRLIPFSMLSGAILMIIVDVLSRTLAPNEIPLSIITGILGTPVFIYAIYKRRMDIK